MSARVKVITCQCANKYGFTNNPEFSNYPSLSKRGLWVHAACGRPTEPSYKAWQRRQQKK